MMGRRPATGRFDTREELVERILFLYHTNDQKVATVARSCGVSTGTVNSIIDTHPKPKPRAAKTTSPRKPRHPAGRRKNTEANKSAPLWVTCFQRVDGFPHPFEGQIAQDLGTRLVLKVGRKTASVNRAACSTTPYRKKQ